tara:strand:+ start:791 stop:1075 length:285 start_codon:yes stop_codon:yes gene_type:complete
MIDFGDTGHIVLQTIQIHPENATTRFAQFFPSDNNTVEDMLAILDEGIKTMNDDSSRKGQGEPWSRGILLKKDYYREKMGIPVPCVALNGGEWK